MSSYVLDLFGARPDLDRRLDVARLGGSVVPFNVETVWSVPRRILRLAIGAAASSVLLMLALLVYGAVLGA